MMKRLAVALLIAALSMQASAAGGRLLRALRNANLGASSQALIWSAPVYDAGVAGAAIADCNYFTIKGYRTSGGSLAYSASTANCATLTLTASSIAAGVWYWTVTATDSSGNESDPTPEETTVVP